MKTQKALHTDLEQLKGIRDLVTAYEEIAAARMKRIREEVLKNRDFLTDLSGVFQEVKSSYHHEIEKLKKKKHIDISSLSLIKRNGKTLAVLLSANTGLYGDVVRKTYQTFKSFVESETCDVAIIGAVGRSLAEKDHLKSGTITYFDLADHRFDHDNLKTILAHLIRYERVFVFHGTFKTVLNQEPVATNLTGDTTADQAKAAVEKKYFFEPSLEHILVFFEEEILSSLLEQTVQEANLAKYASRMVSLDRATQNVQKTLDQTRKLTRIFRHQMANKKQLNALAGLRLWQIR